MTVHISISLYSFVPIDIYSVCMYIFCAHKLSDKLSNPDKLKINTHIVQNIKASQAPIKTIYVGGCSRKIKYITWHPKNVF